TPWGRGPCPLRPALWRLRLAVDVLIPVVECVDVFRRDGRRLAQLPGDMDGARHVFAHDRRLHRGAGVPADGEDTVVSHEYRRRPVPGQRRDDALTDVVAADERERADGDLPTELVRHRGEHTGDRLTACGPRRGVGAVRVHDAADLGHGPVDVGVGGTVTGRGQGTVDRAPVKITHNHPIRGQIVVVDPAR